MKSTKLTKQELEALLVPGKWYDLRKEGDNQVAAKYASITNCGQYFRFSEYVRANRREEYNGSWYPPDTIKEIDESQIQCIDGVWQIIDLPPKEINYEIY